MTKDSNNDSINAIFLTVEFNHIRNCPNNNTITITQNSIILTTGEKTGIIIIVLIRFFVMVEFNHI